MNYSERIDKLRVNYGDLIDVLIIEKPQDIYYLTGCHVSVGKLILSASKAYLYLDGRYYEAYRHLSCVEVRLDVDNSGLKSFFSENRIQNSKVAFDSSWTSYDRYRAIKKIVSNDNKLIPLSNPLKDTRVCKDSFELEIMRRAAFLNTLGFEFLVSNLKEGITEREAANNLEVFWKQHGGQRLSFSPIVAFGSNSAIPHHVSGDNKLKSGMVVLLDIGVTVDEYCSDMTRTIFFGEPVVEMLKVYNVVKKAQEAAVQMVAPGVTLKELDCCARGIIKEEGYGDFFTHGLGHGIGLEVHEFPPVKGSGEYGSLVLEKGMVITIEPGVYLSELGGVRIEDTLVVTESGYEILTSASKDLRVIT